MQAGQTTLYTLFEKAENLENGGYYHRLRLIFVDPLVKEPSKQQQLWRKTEQMLGIKFPAE